MSDLTLNDENNFNNTIVGEELNEEELNQEEKDSIQNIVEEKIPDNASISDIINNEPKKRGRKKKEGINELPIPISPNLEEVIIQNEEKQDPGKVEDLEKDLYLDLDMYLSKNDVKQEERSKVILPTGLDVLDAILGGGLPMHFTQLVGNPGCSKSTLAARIFAEGQRLYKPKFLGKYFDSEASMSKDRLMELGVLYPPVVPYDQYVTVEKVVKAIEAMCKFKEDHKEIMEIPSLIIWDSIANTLTEKGMEADSPDRVLGEKARVLAQELPKIVDLLNKYAVSLIGVNQLRDKIEMGIYKIPNVLRYLAGSNIPGGKSLLFNSYQILYLQHVKDLTEYGFNGAFIDVKTVKNKMFTPNLSIRLVLSFEKGFSNFWSNYEFLKTTKRINASAWCSLINYPQLKFRQIQVIEHYRTNKAFREAWKEALDDAIQKEVIDVNKSMTFKNIEVFDEDLS